MTQILSALDIKVESLAAYPSVPAPEENGITFRENARTKALYYADKTEQWCLADDSGLVVDAIGGQPGVYSARFASDRCSDPNNKDEMNKANNEKLLELLVDVPDEQRTGRFVCCLALAKPGEILIETTGIMEGLIAKEESGVNGFGYDPLFFVPEFNCTCAELQAEEKNRISHRGKALVQLVERLRGIL